MSLEFIERKVIYQGYKLMTYTLMGIGEPLLFIHGKPGSSSLYLRESHRQLAEKGFRLHFWDQLGCGQSDKPNDSTLWTVKRYVEETEFIRKSLDLENFHLIGHSWGGMLAIAYALQYQNHLKSLVLSNTTADCGLMQRGLERHKAALGSETVSMMTRCEREGSTEDPAYKRAKDILLHRHVCRLVTWPEALVQTFKNCNLQIFNQMFGPHFFNFTGSVSSFNRSAELEKIKVPCLILQGEYDEIIPECAQEMHTFIKGSELKIFKNASHTPFLETPNNYFEALTSFLKKYS